MPASAPARGLLAAAFTDDAGQDTIVLLNRSSRPLAASVERTRAHAIIFEITDPCRPNETRPTAAHAALVVDPGAIATLTSVPLLRCSDDLGDLSAQHR